MEVNYLYSLTNIIWAIKSRRMIWAGDIPGAFRVLVEKPEGQKTTGKAQEWMADNINMDFQGVR